MASSDSTTCYNVATINSPIAEQANENRALAIQLAGALFRCCMAIFATLTNSHAPDKRQGQESRL